MRFDEDERGSDFDRGYECGYQDGNRDGYSEGRGDSDSYARERFWEIEHALRELADSEDWGEVDPLAMRERVRAIIAETRL